MPLKISKKSTTQEAVNKATNTILETDYNRPRYDMEGDYMYIKYKVDNYIEGHKVSKNFAVWAQNDKDYNWSIIAKPFTTKEEAIFAAKEIAKDKPVLFGGYGV